MGGYGSGRYAFKRTIDACLRIEFPFLKSQGYFKGFGASGTITWTSRGEKTGEISIQSVIYPDKGIGELVLTYSIGGEPTKQRISLVGIPMRFGGHSYYALCPVSYDKCRTLVFSPPRKSFISVKSSGYLYTSQTEDVLDRIRRKRDKAEKKYKQLSKYARISTKDKVRIKYFKLSALWEEYFHGKLSWYNHQIEKLDSRLKRKS